MNTNKLVIGILAHVDAGKTTLAESLLYLSGSIRKLGRVDHKDAFLDTHELERSRGITIFSKQAEFTMGEKTVTLLDTPGHVDFSAEMERTLRVLDYAILVISGTDGVQGHTRTLWRLLRRYQIPVFLFINKMDQPGADSQGRLEELAKRLDGHCIDFSIEQDREEFWESLAMCDETSMERYLENGYLETADISRQIQERNIFPCCFGSALKMEGVEEFLKILELYTSPPEYGEEFGARVYKIARDTQGNRLTYMKLTGGSLKVKTILTNKRETGKQDTSEIWREKADQIRIYSGNQFQMAEEVKAGSICAVTGLGRTFSGEGLGIETVSLPPVLVPVLAYQIQFPQEYNVHLMYAKLCLLEEEEPELHILWDELSNEIHVQVMGEVQIEILKSMIAERFGVEVSFGEGSIVYKETIQAAAEGVGHFEPLRHYAEVHVLLEPAKAGSGMHFAADCKEEMLERNWQKQILTHLKGKRQKGVLIGAEITDMKITLIAGKAHQKHTEGGDFREAAYRAVRQGLKTAQSILLEPVYEFCLEVPSEMVGRALSDIQRMYGNFDAPVVHGETSVITGSAPVKTMRGYQKEVISYTRGHGMLSCTLKGYEPCHNAEEVIAEKGYDSEKDFENPTGSVFCAHGAGFFVSWEEVSKHMHIDYIWKPDEEGNKEQEQSRPVHIKTVMERTWAEEKELEEIFTRTYGTISRERKNWGKTWKNNEYTSEKKEYNAQEHYLLVDGYNIVFSWEELKELAEINLDAARMRLMDILCNYQGFKKDKVILVFDAYRVEGSKGEIERYHNIHVVYTKEAETADQYIEKVTQEIGRKHDVSVATSDGMEQLIIWGQGAKRISAQGLKEEIERANIQIREISVEKENGKTKLFDHLPGDMVDFVEDVRLGKKNFEENEG